MLPTEEVLPSLDQSWKSYLGDEVEAPYFKQLEQRLSSEKERGYTIYPPQEYIFNAYAQTPFEDVKVVIIGQDPYHNPNQANGLAFAVNKGFQQPPSLQNIFKEIQQDIGTPIPDHGDLTGWAQQGVLLLNTVLTVRAHQARSHCGIGWESFTSKTIERLSQQKEGLVFLLWGKDAQAKAELINEEKHFILEASHPSPYSANRGFFGCRHFSQTNEILKSIGKDPINWEIAS